MDWLSEQMRAAGVPDESITAFMEWWNGTDNKCDATVPPGWTMQWEAPDWGTPVLIAIHASGARFCV